jgi:hypothetical protein
MRRLPGPHPEGGTRGRPELAVSGDGIARAAERSNRGSGPDQSIVIPFRGTSLIPSRGNRRTETDAIA